MKKTQFSIDASLTVQDAGERGYVWEGDVNIEDANPFDLESIARLVEKEGYKLGCARAPLSEKDTGLYRPLTPSGL